MPVHLSWRPDAFTVAVPPADGMALADFPHVAPSSGLEIPPGAVLVRDKRTRKKFLAVNLRETRREVTFDGQLVHKDASGVRIYPSRPRRLTAGRVEIIARNDGVA